MFWASWSIYVCLWVMKRNRRRNYCKCPSRVTEGKGENEDREQDEKLNPEVAVTMKIKK